MERLIIKNFLCIEEACKQLERTVIACKSRHHNIKKECYIVATKIKIPSTRQQAYKKQFSKINALLKFTTCQESISI